MEVGGVSASAEPERPRSVNLLSGLLPSSLCCGARQPRALAAAAPSAPSLGAAPSMGALTSPLGSLASPLGSLASPLGGVATPLGAPTAQAANPSPNPNPSPDPNPNPNQV